MVEIFAKGFDGGLAGIPLLVERWSAGLGNEGPEAVTRKEMKRVLTISVEIVENILEIFKKYILPDEEPVRMAGDSIALEIEKNSYKIFSTKSFSSISESIF